MRFLEFTKNRVVRLIALLVLLSATVLAALWQYTSATGDFVLPPASVAHHTPAPSASPQATATPTPTPRPTATPTATAGFIVPDPASLTVAVNKQRALPISYVPAGLTVPNVPLRYGPTVQQSHLRAEAATALEQMFAAATSNGAHLVLVSGYRSGAYQQTLYNNSVRSYGLAATDQAIARPGHSEHQTGLAADLGRSDQACEIAACFGTTAEGQWLVDHAADYGFIIRYPAGRTNLTGYEYEPWHVRYVGVTAAKAMKAADLILEQYLGLPFAPEY